MVPAKSETTTITRRSLFSVAAAASTAIAIAPTNAAATFEMYGCRLPKGRADADLVASFESYLMAKSTADDLLSRITVASGSIPSELRSGRVNVPGQGTRRARTFLTCEVDEVDEYFKPDLIGSANAGNLNEFIEADHLRRSVKRKLLELQITYDDASERAGIDDLEAKWEFWCIQQDHHLQIIQDTEPNTIEGAVAQLELFKRDCLDIGDIVTDDEGWAQMAKRAIETIRRLGTAHA